MENIFSELISKCHMVEERPNEFKSEEERRKMNKKVNRNWGMQLSDTEHISMRPWMYRSALTKEIIYYLSYKINSALAHQAMDELYILENTMYKVITFRNK